MIHDVWGWAGLGYELDDVDCLHLVAFCVLFRRFSYHVFLFLFLRLRLCFPFLYTPASTLVFDSFITNPYTRNGVAGTGLDRTH